MTPEGRCTRCSATQYFSEHEPMTDQSSAAVEEAARLLAAYDANTSNGAAALQAAAPRLIRALLASRQPLREEMTELRNQIERAKWSAEADEAKIAQLTREKAEAQANNARSICVWCGTITPFPNGPEVTPEERVRVMWEHAEGCEKRPERRLADALEASERQYQQMREALGEIVMGNRAFYGDPSSDHPQRVKDAVFMILGELADLLTGESQPQGSEKGQR
jgi:cell division septum initiation protein DivIVA